MSKKATVSAVIVTYNRKKLFFECLNAVLNQTIRPTKIIIVDNNSTDETYEEFKKQGLENNKIFIYKRLQQNIGGSGGFYEGIKLANKSGCDWVWVMDDDTIPKPNCLERLIRAEKTLKEDRISFLASSIFGEDGEPMNVPSIDLTPAANGYVYWYDKLDKGVVRIANATFVSLLIKRKAIDKVGYPVKDYFIWGDDIEYTTRLIWYYGPAYLVGDSYAIHKRKGSKELSIREETDKRRIKMYYYLYRNLSINQREYYGKKAVKKKLKNDLRLQLNILFSKKCKNRFLKIHTITKGNLAYIFRKYDFEAFRDRFNKNVKYKNV